MSVRGYTNRVLLGEVLLLLLGEGTFSRAPRLSISFQTSHYATRVLLEEVLLLFGEGTFFRAPRPSMVFSVCDGDSWSGGHLRYEQQTASQKHKLLA